MMGSPQEKVKLVCQLLDLKNAALFTSLCRLASSKLFEVASELDEVDKIYLDEDLKQLRKGYNKLHKIFIESTRESSTSV